MLHIGRVKRTPRTSGTQCRITSSGSGVIWTSCAWSDCDGDSYPALRRFEWVVSHFGSCGTDAKENSPRRARRTRRVEFNELANRVVDCALKVLSQLDPELLELPYEQCLSPLRALRVLRGGTILCPCESHKPFLSPVRCTHSSRKGVAAPRNLGFHSLRAPRPRR